MNLALCYERVIPAKGGAEVFLADLIRRLVADRHEVHLYAYERDAAALPSGLIFHALVPAGGPRFLRPWRFAAACERALQRDSHDVILGFMKTWYQDVILPQAGLHVASAEYNLRKYRHPLVRELVRALKWFDPSSWSYWLLERRQYLGRYQPIIIASSKMVQQHFREYYGLGPERVRVIYNAVDPRRFADRDRLRLRAEIRDTLSIGAEEAVGLFVGHNYRLKGLDPLLLAIRELPPASFRLLVCGSSGTRRYRRLARRLGVAQQVHFLGSQAAMRSYYFASDFLVHPTFYDPCSLVVLEALACGLPVITTSNNGAGELLHPPHDGFVLDDPHDYRELAQHIEALCDASYRAACSQAARQTAASWTYEDHYRALLEVFSEVAKAKRAA